MKKNDEVFDIFKEALKSTKATKTLEKCECGGDIVKYKNEYYCKECLCEYEKCPNCNELVPEDFMTYHYEDRVCSNCIEDGYGE